MAITYKVHLTPLVSNDVYGAEMDVSKYVLEAGIGKVRKGLDSSDYDFGSFIYGDITLKLTNDNGLFNDSSDGRSVFPLTRDRAKVKIQYRNISTAGEITDTITFEGMINEEGTRQDAQKSDIKFKVLSLDSVIRNTKVSGGTVASGSTIKTALSNILNVPRITSILNFSSSNMNPDLNYTIDDGSAFDNLKTKEALDLLLRASNSVFVIDSSNNMIVRDRQNTDFGTIHNLYGPYDIYGRENIISIKKFNSGYHRMFNIVDVEGVVRENIYLQDQFGARKKTLSLDFITSEETKTLVANRLLGEFKAPKIELELEVETSLANQMDILDFVSINYPLRIGAPNLGDELPTIGITKIGATNEPLPKSFGSLWIEPKVAFKIIEIIHDAKSFTSTLKIRQAGTELNDGVYNTEDSGLVGFAVIGVAKIAGTADAADTWNPSTLGGAKIGLTKIA